MLFLLVPDARVCHVLFPLFDRPYRETQEIRLSFPQVHDLGLFRGDVEFQAVFQVQADGVVPLLGGLPIPAEDFEVVSVPDDVTFFEIGLFSGH